MFPDRSVHQLPDADPGETREWLDALDQVVATEGEVRAHYLLARLVERARELGTVVAGSATTDYINTIPVGTEPDYPGDRELEYRIRACVRWNAVAMVQRANHRSDGLGGHLSTYASAATLFEVGFHHFFRGRDAAGGGDQVFFQGHASPGVYARAFVEGRLTADDLDRFRREVSGGLPSYPHPRRMPEFWEFPTVSMGLGPLNAIAQARFNRYLTQRGIVDASAARVWAFLGDGELDEPESGAALGLAAREGLDNLTFVVNCNLQRLDGPVRGNGKIIQELEARFRGAGWNVVKVVWGSGWDALLARDVDGVLLERMNETVDGDYQKYVTEPGAYIRSHFFGTDPRLEALVAHLSDEDLERLPRGGHDVAKVHAAYRAAVEHRGAPTVVLAKTVKGWALGRDFAARNSTHQLKKMSVPQLRELRDRLALPIADAAIADGLAPYYRPDPGSPEAEYLAERRDRLGGPVPRRTVAVHPLPAPEAAVGAELLAGSGERHPVSTTNAFTRLLRSLLRDPGLGRRIVPIVPDEARTFGMDALFPDFRIYAPFGQRYEPVDAGLVLAYREAADGQILEEGITEAGSLASFTAAATAYATWGEPMIPFFVFYSMFGFQRVADLIWSLGDQMGKGFLCGATAGRTTLAGEGLQHCDGQSHLFAMAFPDCRAYDPATAYEVAVLVRDGIDRMYGERSENCFYYLTLYNENVDQPPMPDGVEAGIIAGLYRFAGVDSGSPAARILASGSMLNEAREAQRRLAADHGIAVEVWSAPGWKQLRDEAEECERWNRLHPGEPQRVPYVTAALGDSGAPVVAVSDWVRGVPDAIARFVPARYHVLGTDGYGLSDVRSELRRYFGVDAAHITVAVLAALAAEGTVAPDVVSAAITAAGIESDSPRP